MKQETRLKFDFTDSYKGWEFTKRIKYVNYGAFVEVYFEISYTAHVYTFWGGKDIQITDWKKDDEFYFVTIPDETIVECV